MSDALLTSPDREEALSRAYASAVAAAAGYVTSQPDFDRDSIDIIFSAGGGMRPNVHAQLKATINLRRVGSNHRFVLNKKNYDDLRAQTQVPRILIVLGLPRQDASWLNITVNRLMIKRCAYWTSLAGLPDLPTKQQSVTIDVPSVNHFDVAALQNIMAMARSGAVK